MVMPCAFSVRLASLYCSSLAAGGIGHFSFHSHHFSLMRNGFNWQVFTRTKTNSNIGEYFIQKFVKP
jgi:hypothetical protein